MPLEKPKHAVTFAEHATDPAKLAIVVGPSGKITKAVSKVRLHSLAPECMCLAAYAIRCVMPNLCSWSAPLDKHLGQYKVCSCVGDLLVLQPSQKGQEGPE